MSGNRVVRCGVRLRTVAVIVFSVCALAAAGAAGSQRDSGDYPVVDTGQVLCYDDSDEISPPSVL